MSGKAKKLYTGPHICEANVEIKDSGLTVSKEINPFTIMIRILRNYCTGNQFFLKFNRNFLIKSPLPQTKTNAERIKYAPCVRKIWLPA